MGTDYQTCACSSRKNGINKERRGEEVWPFEHLSASCCTNSSYWAQKHCKRGFWKGVWIPPHHPCLTSQITADLERTRVASFVIFVKEGIQVNHGREMRQVTPHLLHWFVTFDDSFHSCYISSKTHMNQTRCNETTNHEHDAATVERVENTSKDHGQMKRTASNHQPRGNVVSAFAPEPASMTTGREKSIEKKSNQRAVFVFRKQQQKKRRRGAGGL